jgi:ribulose-phosphate 3-epimerase
VNRVTLPIQIAPSVLPADFSKFGEEIHALDEAGVDIIQFDVMDGQFVPNLTFGPDVIAAVRPYTTKPFEAHLMVYTPDVMAQRYVEAGCQRLIVHAEACTHLHRTLENIRNMGATAAVALNPHTPASTVENILDLVDMVLVMTVNPGFGGQSYISPTTIVGAAKAGANVLIAGSALYKDPQGLGHAVTELRALATAAFAD